LILWIDLFVLSQLVMPRVRGGSVALEVLQLRKPSLKALDLGLCLSDLLQTLISGPLK